MTKQWWASKTLWTAAVTFGLTLASEAFGPDVAGKVQQYIALGLPILMGILRAITTEGIVLGSHKAE